MEKLFEIIPFLGYYHEQCKKFIDKDIFEPQFQNYIRLTKVKVWYGTVSPNINLSNGNRENIYGKFILGIQCDYHNSITGEKKQTEMHCGSLHSIDIITKDIELNEGDYICKFYICYNDIISYIKFITKKEIIFEIGNYNKDCEKTISFNNDESPHMIQSFHGYYNEYGLRALGCIHIKRKNYFFLNLIDVFRYRHKLKNNKEEKEKWNEDNITKLGYNEKAFIKLCLLPDSQFSIVIKYCC